MPSVLNHELHKLMLLPPHASHRFLSTPRFFLLYQWTQSRVDLQIPCIYRELGRGQRVQWNTHFCLLGRLPALFCLRGAPAFGLRFSSHRVWAQSGSSPCFNHTAVSFVCVRPSLCHALPKPYRRIHDSTWCRLDTYCLSAYMQRKPGARHRLFG